MEYPGEKLNAGLPEAMFTVTSWLYSGGDIPLLTVQDGLLEPDVPGFQQTSLLELVVSVNHPWHFSSQWQCSWAVECSAREDWVRILLALLCSSLCLSFPHLANVHLQAITIWDLVEHSCLLCSVWSFRCTNICWKVEVVGSRYEHLAELGYVEWTWRGAGCMGSLPWLLVSPLLNSAGWNWLLCTCHHSYVVLGSHCF